MKNMPTPEASDAAPDDELLPEYDFDYSKARPNRFAGQVDYKEQLVVVLDPDIAQVFTTPEAVKAVLRALIATMPGIAQSGTIGGTPTTP